MCRRIEVWRKTDNAIVAYFSFESHEFRYEKAFFKAHGDAFLITGGKSSGQFAHVPQPLEIYMRAARGSHFQLIEGGTELGSERLTAEFPGLTEQWRGQFWKVAVM